MTSNYSYVILYVFGLIIIALTKSYRIWMMWYCSLAQYYVLPKAFYVQHRVYIVALIETLPFIFIVRFQWAHAIDFVISFITISLLCMNTTIGVVGNSAPPAPIVLLPVQLALENRKSKCENTIIETKVFDISIHYASIICADDGLLCFQCQCLVWLGVGWLLPTRSLQLWCLSEQKKTSLGTLDLPSIISTEN